MRQLGYLINGIEFIPQAIVDQHIPFGQAPDQTIEVVWSMDDERDALDIAVADLEESYHDELTRLETERDALQGVLRQVQSILDRFFAKLDDDQSHPVVDDVDFIPPPVIAGIAFGPHRDDSKSTTAFIVAATEAAGPTEDWCKYKTTMDPP